MMVDSIFTFFTSLFVLLFHQYKCELFSVLEISVWPRSRFRRPISVQQRLRAQFMFDF